MELCSIAFARLPSACALQEVLLGDWLCFSLITDCAMDLQCLPAPVATSMPVSEGLAPLPSDSDAKGLPTSLPAAGLLASPDCGSLPAPDSVEDFTDGDIIGEELDSLLDSLAEGSPYPLVRMSTAWVPCFLLRTGPWRTWMCLLSLFLCHSFLLALPLVKLIHSFLHFCNRLGLKSPPLSLLGCGQLHGLAHQKVPKVAFLHHHLLPGLCYP